MSGKPKLHILLCAPRGFCAGVDRAIQIVELALERYGAPVYVRHEIVHNRYVVEGLKAKGAVFVEELDEIPETDAPVVFSAHGVPKAVPDERQPRATSSSSTPPARWSPRCTWRRSGIINAGREIVLIGHAGHPEVIGTMGQLPAGRDHPGRDGGGCARVHAARSGQSRLRDADDAFGRRYGGDRRAC